MIAIKMRFLAGRFHATPWGHQVNEGAVEYPPSLWRFLRSLVATFHRTAPVAVDEMSLRRILDALSDTPEFRLPPASVAHTRHYDQANSSIKFFDTFVSLDPNAEIVWIWRSANLEAADRENLAKILRNLGTFGRSESWCEAELIDDFAEEANSAPVSGNASFSSGKETIRLLMPNETGDKLFESLRIETSTMRSKQKQLEPNGTRWVTYERKSNLLTPRRIAPKKERQEKKATVARFALYSKVLPSVTNSLIFSEQARAALSSPANRINNHHSPAFIGKEWDEAAQEWKPMKGHQHAHFFVSDEIGDGKIHYLTIHAPCGFVLGDVKAFENIRKIERHYKNLPAVQVILSGLGNKEDFPKVPIFKKSKIWRSVTPFSLPYFPNRGRGKAPRPKDLPEAQLRKELRSRNLPDPIRIKQISGYNMEKRPEIRWLEFQSQRLRKNLQGKGLYGFEIEFANEIEGPIALGFGCHFGLGLFLPVTQ